MSAHPHESEQVIDFMMAPPSPKGLQRESGKSKRSTLNGFTGLVRKVNGAIFRSKGDAEEDQYLDHDFHLGLGSSTEHHAMNFDELYGDEDEAYDLNRYSVNTQNSELPHEVVNRHSPLLKISGPTETGDMPELNNYTIAEEDEEVDDDDDEESARMTAFINGEHNANSNELMPPPTRLRRYVSKETIASVYRIIESYQKEDSPSQQDGCSALPTHVETSSIHSGNTSGSNPIPEMAALELHELGGRRSSGSLPPKPSRATQLLTSLSHLQNQMGSQPPSPTTHSSQASLGRRRSAKSVQSRQQSIINMQRSPTVESGSGYSTFVDVFCDYRDAWLGEEEEELEHLEEERLKALYSLIASEKKFVRALQLMRNAFIEPLRLNAAKSNRFIHRSYTKDEITNIFGSIEQLLPRHEKLLRDLEQSALDRKQTGIMENAIAAFTQNCRWLRLHMDYLRQYPQMLFDLVQLQKRSTHFRRTLKTCTANAGFVNVRALLAAPKGRVHQYNAFILQLLDLYQPEDPDYMTIKLCADDLERMDKECSLMLLFVQQRESVIQVQSSLNGLDDKFVSSTRRLIHQGSLYQGEKSWDKFEPRIAFLFDDLLVLAKEQAEGRRVLQHRIDTRTATVQEMHGVIVIACDSGKKFYLQAENADQHNYWMQCFRTVMRSTGTGFTGALGTLSFA
ncbi:Dbl homology domain-containing protein [Syncephalis plumigaleata]|nr:Dbl homology domain-containing protein [Syncephalis plumigaleata]